MKLRRLLLIIGLLAAGVALAPFSAQATSYTWSIGGSGNWGTSSNWAPKIRSPWKH